MEVGPRDGQLGTELRALRERQGWWGTVLRRCATGNVMAVCGDGALVLQGPAGENNHDYKLKTDTTTVMEDCRGKSWQGSSDGSAG